MWCNQWIRQTSCYRLRISARPSTNTRQLHLHSLLSWKDQIMSDESAIIIKYYHRLHIINLSLLYDQLLHSFPFTSCLEQEPMIKLGLRLLCINVVIRNLSCIRNGCKPKTSKMNINNTEEPFKNWHWKQKKCIIWKCLIREPLLSKNCREI